MGKHKKKRREIYNNDYTGVVEDVLDPKKIGRVRVRIERFHGRKGEKESIPTEDLPWLEPDSRGNDFGVPNVGKVVYVAFEEGDYYKGSYFAEEHYDINLQAKIETYANEDYSNFYALYYDAKHQYYHDPKLGIFFDYMKSNINMKTNGDIRINLKDNTAKLYLGTEDASQQAVLGNHWMDWFDEFVDNLIGAKGGPYLGNLGAPVIPHPSMTLVLNKYKAFRETFLSKHVYIVDNQKVKPQKRKFDKLQWNDNWNTEDMKKNNSTPASIPDPAPRKESGGNPDVNVPPTNYSANLSTSTLPPNPSVEEVQRTEKPFSQEHGNGKIPTENLTASKYLTKSFSGDTDERKFLLDEAAVALDKWLDKYNSQRDETWDTSTTAKATKGYQNFERQTNSRKQYSTAPLAGEDPFGWANQVEIYFGVDSTDEDTVFEITEYIYKGIMGGSDQLQAFILLRKLGRDFGWKIAGKTSKNEVQWWHWIYSPGT